MSEQLPCPPPLTEEEWAALIDAINEETPTLEEPNVVILDKSKDIPLGSVLAGAVIGWVVSVAVMIGGVL